MVLTAAHTGQQYSNNVDLAKIERENPRKQEVSQSRRWRMRSYNFRYRSKIDWELTAEWGLHFKFGADGR